MRKQKIKETNVIKEMVAVAVIITKEEERAVIPDSLLT